MASAQAVQAITGDSVLTNAPPVNAVLEESTLSPLRSVQHRDVYGNVISMYHSSNTSNYLKIFNADHRPADPDLSNPTRPRLERPLDTIRSFEKAIDNGYKRRSSYMRSESDSNIQQPYDRRQSGYGKSPHSRTHSSLANRLAIGYDAGPNQNRYANGNGGGYYGGQRAESMVGGGGPRRHPNARMGSESMMYGQRQYPQHAHQQSQDTGSDSTGPWANSTDPSSENSSIDRIAPPAKPYGENGYPNNAYGQNGFGPGQHGFQGAIPEEGGSYPMRGGAPPVQAPERRPIPLGNSGDAPMPGGSLPSTKRPEAEKRKSWLSRRFSKKN